MLFILSFSLNSISSRTKYSSFYWLCFLPLPFSRLYPCCPPSQDPFLTFCYDLSVPQRYVWKDWNVPWIFLCEEFGPWYGRQRWHMTLKNEVQCSLKVLLQKILRSFFCEPLVILRCCLVWKLKLPCNALICCKHAAPSLRHSAVSWQCLLHLPKDKLGVPAF